MTDLALGPNSRAIFTCARFLRFWSCGKFYSVSISISLCLIFGISRGIFEMLPLLFRHVAGVSRDMSARPSGLVAAYLWPARGRAY